MGGCWRGSDRRRGYIHDVLLDAGPKYPVRAKQWWLSYLKERNYLIVATLMKVALRNERGPKQKNV